ncbi:DUF4056 domain-containing protein [Agarivorans sp. 1_MG-2023]|uniref:DUF4056 domain-containing protein n=1 Tax=Agarivorans sp. 1_MG-2023 TaxID=3062634 RepID=UPI0026E2FE60|nr:DUF4056 domain-containing protein [Agarivorans sp. 1_MG-2023]MDO6762827.1 DUF4056 domain-containing protein [Agarivorans sp. 1_MG-2023]
MPNFINRLAIAAQQRLTTLITLLLLSTLSACSSSDWQSRNHPSDDAVAAALTEQPDMVVLSQQTPLQFSLARMPEDVRPCCAFGNNHKVKVGSIQVPMFRYANTLSLDEIGPHAYEAGTWSLQRGEPNGRRHGENNGQIYTLRGGFIDLAHVRDTADNTVALFQRIYPQLGQAFSIELPPEIGPRELRFQAFSIDQLSPQQRLELAAQLAARMAYSMAEAHEIAQWHGYRSWKPWSETVSAYSPEDLYSNMLGAKIGLALIMNNLVMSRELYNQHMTQWLSASITQLHPVSKAQTNAFFDAIDGHWWDSNIALPSKFMLLKRHYQLGKQQAPYIVPQALAQADESWPLLAPLYAKRLSPLPLSLPATVYGIDLAGVAQQWLTVAPKFQGSFSHIPKHLWQSGFSNRKFLAISHFNQLQDEIELQAHFDQGTVN